MYLDQFRHLYIKTHFNLGANTAILWFMRNEAQIARTQDFLRSDRLRIDIDRPNRPDPTESAKHIDPKANEARESPAYFYLGETVALKVAVSNVQVGHAFPGGTTDINEAWIHFRVTDGQGTQIYESGFLDADGNVEPNAYFYKSTPIDHFGNAVWRHDLFNMVGDSFKRIIPPGGTDVASYSFAIPDWAKGSLVVSAELQYRKLNNRYAKWALQDETVKLPITTMAAETVKLPLRIQPEVYRSSM
jgi:hypothetical protein